MIIGRKPDKHETCDKCEGRGFCEREMGEKTEERAEKNEKIEENKDSCEGKKEEDEMSIEMKQKDTFSLRDENKGHVNGGLQCFQSVDL